MEIPIRFLGGPLDGQTMFTTWLSEVKVFFPEEKQVLLYLREPGMIEGGAGELDYVYDPLRSRGLSERYDETFQKLMVEQPVRPVRVRNPAPLFSDKPIFGGSYLPQDNPTPEPFMYLAPQEPQEDTPDNVLDLDPPTGAQTGPDGFLPPREEFTPSTEYYPRDGDPDDDEAEERPDADYQ